jgi:hypothetical protein
LVLYPGSTSRMFLPNNFGPLSRSEMRIIARSKVKVYLFRTVKNKRDTRFILVESIFASKYAGNASTNLCAGLRSSKVVAQIDTGESNSTKSGISYRTITERS